MLDYLSLNKEELEKEFAEVSREYEHYRSMHLALDMSRGKPSSDSMDVSQQMFDSVGNHIGFKNMDGIDCRNYGGLDGLKELKKLFAEILELSPEQIIVGGNSSLNMMFDTIAQAMTHGMGGEPWGRQDGLKFLCPVPGYDRHFAITEYFGFELIPVPTTEEGPDMDVVEELIKDEAVKGMWCVPKYSNPTGNTYSDETVRRLAKMECAAPDFRIMWDNAYAVHDLGDETDELLDIFTEAEKWGHEDRIFYYASTSKITFPGGGVAMLAASERNLAQIATYLGVQTIGYDKLNQLRHTTYFKDKESIKSHMKILADFIGRKFDITLASLSELEGLGIAEWTNPKGGYFISLDVMEGTARRVYELSKKAGVTLTTVGATYPYGIDPLDKNLRIAPTYPTDGEVECASKILVIAVKMAAIEKLLKK